MTILEVPIRTIRIRNVTGSSGMVYESIRVPDGNGEEGDQTDVIKPGEIEGTPLIPIYEGD